jgi:hypothetical protein
MLTLLTAGLGVAVGAAILLAIAHRAERRARIRAESGAFRQAVFSDVSLLVSDLRRYHAELAAIAERERAAAEVRARVAERRSRALLDLREPQQPMSVKEPSDRTTLLPEQDRDEARSC